MLQELGRDYRSAKSAAVELTTGDIIGRERCEDSASVQGTTGYTSARTAPPKQKACEVSLQK